MQLSFELPTKHLDTLGNHNEYNFTLAHMTADEQYLTYYRESTKYTITDNSAFELQYPLANPDIVKAALLLKAQEVIAPDVPRDGRKTLQATNAFIKYLEDSGNLGKFKVMGVVQGKNAPDWFACLTSMRDNPHIDIIGLSYMGCSSAFGLDAANSRIGAAHISVHPASGGLKKQIHLLGIGGNPLELKAHQDIPNIRSCDTSLPIVHGLIKDKIDPVTGHTGLKLPRPENYFDIDVDADQMDAINHNIKALKSWAASPVNV